MKNMKMVVLTAVLAVCAGAAFAAEPAVPPGYRAAFVPADRAEMLFIQPGSRLDMTVTFGARMTDDRKETVTATILQNVLVLDTVDKDGLHGVLLALNPNEAQYAMLCLTDGYRVHFTMRGKGDTEMHPMEIASFKRLFVGDSEDKAAEKNAEKPADKPAPAKAP
jgi:Flp pilus assembly protein CpaB